MGSKKKTTKGKAPAKKSATSAKPVKKTAVKVKPGPSKKVQKPVKKSVASPKSASPKKAQKLAKKPASRIKPAPAKKAQPVKKTVTPAKPVPAPEIPATRTQAAYERPASGATPARKKSRSWIGVLILLIAVVAIIAYLFYPGLKEKKFWKTTEKVTEVIKPAQETTAPAEKPAEPVISPVEDDACIYVVQPKDSLVIIAAKKLGDYARWKEIYRDNKDQIKDPYIIYAGQKLKVGCK